MAGKYKEGDTAYIVENGKNVRKAVVLKNAAGLCSLQFPDDGVGVKLQESRLFSTREEAEGSLKGKGRSGKF